MSQGYYTCTLLIEDEDPELANKKAERMSKVINNLGVITTIETTKFLESFFGSIPGEIQILANATGKKDYYVKSDLGSRRFELALGEKTLKLIASDSADQKKIS